MGDEVRAVDAAGADLDDLDVMATAFVPTFRMAPMHQGVSATPGGFDASDDFALRPLFEAFAKAGCATTLHAEAGPHLHRSLQAIRALGKNAGVSLNPGTPITAIEYVIDVIDLVLVMLVNPGFGGQAFIPSALGKISDLAR